MPVLWLVIWHNCKCGVVVIDVLLVNVYHGVWQAALTLRARGTMSADPSLVLSLWKQASLPLVSFNMLLAPFIRLLGHVNTGSTQRADIGLNNIWICSTKKRLWTLTCCFSTLCIHEGGSAINEIPTVQTVGLEQQLLKVTWNAMFTALHVSNATLLTSWPARGKIQM